MSYLMTSNRLKLGDFESFKIYEARGITSFGFGIINKNFPKSGDIYFHDDWFFDREEKTFINCTRFLEEDMCEITICNFEILAGAINAE